jgi:hypothetical protein
MGHARSTPQKALRWPGLATLIMADFVLVTAVTAWHVFGPAPLWGPL